MAQARRTNLFESRTFGVPIENKLGHGTFRIKSGRLDSLYVSHEASPGFIIIIRGFISPIPVLLSIVTHSSCVYL